MGYAKQRIRLLLCLNDTSRFVRTKTLVTRLRFQRTRYGPQRPLASTIFVCATHPRFVPSNWWSQSGSNRRPPACKAGALPAELWPLKWDRVDGSTLPILVGLGGLEPPASPLSGVRSNHLSYRPIKLKDPSPYGAEPFTPSACGCAGVLCGRLTEEGLSFSKGGDPAAPSDTATLLRLHPSHEPLRGRRPPCG